MIGTATRGPYSQTSGGNSSRDDPVPTTPLSTSAAAANRVRRMSGQMPSANALRNMVIGAGVMVSATIFVIFGSVQWSAVLPLALGMLVGSRVGPIVARRLPTNILRWLIVLFGMALAVDLFLHPSV